ncbi:hypothetical protein MKK50_15120 [Methylobacterium sp. J-043]|nr:hypothetical protein [Methylobacterium sp. J-043]
MRGATGIRKSGNAVLLTGSSMSTGPVDPSRDISKLVSVTMKETDRADIVRRAVALKEFTKYNLQDGSRPTKRQAAELLTELNSYASRIVSILGSTENVSKPTIKN